MMHLGYYLLVGSLLSLSLPFLVSSQTCPGAGIPGLPGEFKNTNTCSVVLLWLIISLPTLKVFLGILAKMVVMDWEERKESQVIKVMNDIFFPNYLSLSLNKKGCEQSEKGQAAVSVNLDTLFVHFSCIWTLNWEGLTSRLCQQQRNPGRADLALR